MRGALTRIKELVHGSYGRHVLAAVGWHQGRNNCISDNFTAGYEANLTHFIRDLRSALGAPDLPLVIAETGVTGPGEKHTRALALMTAQAAVATHPEFKGNVPFVGTRAFWRPVGDSPNAKGYHWNSNAETYTLIGEAMAKAMKRLMPRSPATSQP